MDNKTEVWLRHPEIEKIEVSSFGRVRTLDRIVPSSWNRTRLVKGRILKQNDNGSGYLQVSVKVDGKWTKKYVHRLVAQTFIKNNGNLPEVNHKDNDRTNNHVDNLEFCTRSYNMKYKEKFGISNAELKGHPLFTINLDTLEVSQFKSQHEAGRKLGVFNENINKVIKGKYKQTHGYWFMEDDDNAVDLTKQKLREIGKTKLTAADAASTDFVSQVITE